MKTVLNIIVSLVCVVLTNANSSNDTEKTLKNLEKEKYELVLKIQKAIDDSAKALRKNNDSDSITGLEHLLELKKHFNETAIEDKKEFNASRRSEHPRYIQKGKVKLDLFDIANLFDKKDAVKKLAKEKNQAVMREKLKEWIAEKEREKLSIKAYKARMNVIAEKCPRSGRSNKKKKHNRRSLDYKPSPSEERKKQENNQQDEQWWKERAERRKNRRRKYPCCRKCCKKSYLGCL